MMDRKEVVITDLKCFQPQSAISFDTELFKWKAVDYETENFNGTMVFTTGENHVPELSYNPGLEGWYAIYVGIVQLTFPIDQQMRLTGFKLSKDRYPRYFDYEPSWYWNGDMPRIHEVLWKHDDMTGQCLELIHPETAIPSVSNAAYFRFVPLDENEVNKIKKDRADGSNKRILAHHDMHSIFYDRNPKSADDLIAAALEPFRYSDVGTVLLEYIVDVNNPEKNDFFYGSLNPPFYTRKGDKRVEDCKKRFVAEGIDIYDAMVKYAHEIGLDVRLTFRMNDFVCSCPWDETFTADFYKRNPQFRCRDKDGDEVARLSYAYREVQDWVIDIFKDMLKSGADGIHMLFNRGLPCALYEDPLVEEFTETTGKNPFDLGEEDPEWVKFRCSYFTEHFIKRVRRELDEYSISLGRSKKPYISVHAFGDERTNLFFGLDVYEWAKEGLIDLVVGYPIIMDSPYIVHADRAMDVNMDYYAELSRNTSVKSYVDMLPRRMEPGKFISRAEEIYAKGIDGICMWDANTRAVNPDIWAVASRIGHKEELDLVKSNQDKLLRVHKIRKIGGIKVHKYPPFWGF